MRVYDNWVLGPLGLGLETPRPDAACNGVFVLISGSCSTGLGFRVQRFSISYRHSSGSFPKLGLPYSGVLTIRILLFRVLY